jgi:hypothetical protein
MIKLSNLLSFVAGLFAAPTGFGSAGIRRHRICGALIIYGNWAGQRGVELDETGISVRSFEVRYFPFVNEKLMSNVGEPRARAISDKFSREVTVAGEVTGTTGIMAFTLGTQCTVANDVDDFGDGSGDLLLDEATVSQERANWRSVSAKLSSDPGVSE